jgi:putative ABC transport system permease protein
MKTDRQGTVHTTYANALRQYASDLPLGLENLLVHKLRSLLTMLGMIFGVGAVVSMLSIGAGARQKVMAFIQQLGVRNLIVESKEVTNTQEREKIRRTSPGLTFEDLRFIRDDLKEIEDASPRKRFTPAKLIPKPQQDSPVVYGVAPAYQQIAGLRVIEGRFFDQEDDDHAAPVCVLGSAAKLSLFGSSDPLSQYVKVNDQWFHVIGVVAPQLSAQTDVAGIPAQDSNNLIYSPENSVIMRLEDSTSETKDEIDGIYLRLGSGSDASTVAEIVRGILNVSHHNAGISA